MKLQSWWYALTGRARGSKRYLAKVRRGGPWNKELELYYSLMEGRQVTAIDEEGALQHQTDVDEKADKVLQRRTFSFEIVLICIHESTAK